MTNRAPYAPVGELPNNGGLDTVDGYIIWDEDATFTWSYQDPDFEDWQSRADFRYRDSAGGGPWTTVDYADTDTYSYTLPASTWMYGVIYEYQISVFDTAGLQSPWSESRLVGAIITQPPPTITTPTEASAQTVTPMPFAWNPTYYPQDAYQVLRCENADGSGVVYYDSGIVLTNGQGSDSRGKVTLSIPLDVATARTEYVILTCRHHSTLWSPPAVVSIVVTIEEPKTPLFTVTQVSPGRPEVVISIAATDGFIGYTPTLFNDILRDGVRIATNIPDGGSYIDSLPGAGPVEYTIHGTSEFGAKTISY